MESRDDCDPRRLGALDRLEYVHSIAEKCIERLNGLILKVNPEYWRGESFRIRAEVLLHSLARNTRHLLGDGPSISLTEFTLVHSKPVEVSGRFFPSYHMGLLHVVSTVLEAVNVELECTLDTEDPISYWRETDTVTADPRPRLLPASIDVEQFIARVRLQEQCDFQPLTHGHIDWLYAAIEQEYAFAVTRCQSDGEPTAPKSDGEPATPKTYLSNWREILDTLDKKKNKSSRDQVKYLNELYDGPIIVRGQGSQPIVEKTKCIDWWNKLEILTQDAIHQAWGKSLEAQQQYDYGRSGTVVPEISGGVKKRRKTKPSG